MSGEVNWWFFAKSHGEGTIKVTLTWAGNAPTNAPITQPGAEPGPDDGS